MSEKPSAAVLAGFGVRGDAAPVPGGRGRTWRGGDIILKPSGLLAEVDWIAEVLSTLPDSPLFRVARPVRATTGDWSVDGWEAWDAVAGEPNPQRWDDIMSVGIAFHEALAGLPRPRFLDARDDPWSFGDRLAWEEWPLDGSEVMTELLVPLAAARRPVDHPAQPVHGDLLGNVLFADGLAPAVIDWPVYFRSPSWALAVAVIDALTWHDAPADLIEHWAHLDDWSQMLVRALMYRIATNEGVRRKRGLVRESAKAYQHVVDLVLASVRASRIS
jgi:uncharacterized protein (TIGR02569 family)